jgi:hypothetical protein
MRIILTVALLVMALHPAGTSEAKQNSLADAPPEFRKALCRGLHEAILRETNRPLYAQAIKRRAEGRLLPKSKHRLDTIDSWRVAMRQAKCGNVP